MEKLRMMAVGAQPKKKSIGKEEKPIDLER
jgi:hypothetical protein